MQIITRHFVLLPSTVRNTCSPTSDLVSLLLTSLGSKLCLSATLNFTKYERGGEKWCEGVGRNGGKGRNGEKGWGRNGEKGWGEMVRRGGEKWCERGWGRNGEKGWGEILGISDTNDRNKIIILLL